MIITVCADKGSPGVSWTSVVLTMVWPGERVLVEADVSGGDAALRLRTPDGQFLPQQPSVRALSVDARGGGLSSLSPYTHQTSVSVPVIPATDMGTSAFAAIARQWPAVAAALASWQGTVVADIGRLQEETASGPVAAASTVVLLVGRPTPEGLHHLRERARALTTRLGQGRYDKSPLAVALICPTRTHRTHLDDLRSHLAADPETSDVRVAGYIADDPRAIELLRRGAITKKLTASDLLRSASSIVDTLLSWWPELQRVAARPPVLTTSTHRGTVAVEEPSASMQWGPEGAVDLTDGKPTASPRAASIGSASTAAGGHR